MAESKGKYNDSKWIGKRFGRLVVIEPIHGTNKNGGKQWYWKVKCDCGTEKVVLPNDLVSGHSASCGCLRREGARLPTYHHESHTPLHNIWCGMNNRCNPKHKNIRGYGERGIKVCDEWKDYTEFAKWARDNGYEEGLSIERIDVNGDYCPENCCWIPFVKQARNRRTTHWVEYNGTKMSLAEACEKANLPYKQVFERIVKRNWTVEDALSIPMGCAKRKPKFNSLAQKAREAGINPQTVASRVYAYGWSEERALNTPSAGKGANQTTYNKKK